MIVTGSFLLAFSMQDLYGGSMKYLDGSEKTLFDINIGVVGFGLALILLVSAIIIEMIRSLDFDMDTISLPPTALHNLI